MNNIRILYQDFISMLQILCQGFICVVDRDDTEVVLEVNNQEAHGYILLFRQVVDNLGAQNHVLCFACLQLTYGYYIVDYFLCLLCISRELYLLLQSLRYSLHHSSQFLRLELSFCVNKSRCLNNEVYYLFSSLISLKIGINCMCFKIISNCFIISF